MYVRMTDDKNGYLGALTFIGWQIVTYGQVSSHLIGLDSHMISRSRLVVSHNSEDTAC